MQCGTCEQLVWTCVFRFVICWDSFGIGLLHMHVSRNPLILLKAVVAHTVYLSRVRMACHVARDEQTSVAVGRTQRTCVSATVHSALKNSALSVRERYTQPDDRASKSFADVREVSADLEGTHPLRPATCQRTELRRHSAEHTHSICYLDKHRQRLRAPR